MLVVKPILTKDIMYSFCKVFIGDGLITCEPTKWKKSRKMINPVFNVQLLERYVETLGGPCDEFIKQLEEEIGGDGFDALAYTYLCSLDIICETVMGIKLNAQAKKNSQYVKDARAMAEMIVGRLFSPLKRFYFTYRLTSGYREEGRLAARVHDFTRKIIEDRRMLRETSTAENAFNNGVGRNKKSSLLNVLLDAEHEGRPMTDKELMYETQTFLFAGHDTVATVTALCLYCLSKHSEVQDKVFEELQSIFGSDRRHPTWADLNEMRYLEMVLKETMRFYTPVPFISRLIDEDIYYGEVYIPKGVSVLIFLHGVHMNPEYFPDPEKFDPSRFEAEVKQFAFMPFGAGPRNCIGQRFAMLEMKYIICQVLRRFIILPVLGHVPQRVIQIMLRFKNGAMIRLKSRHTLL